MAVIMNKVFTLFACFVLNHSDSGAMGIAPLRICSYATGQTNEEEKS
jgi:hypothetical protein